QSVTAHRSLETLAGRRGGLGAHPLPRRLSHAQTETKRERASWSCPRYRPLIPAAGSMNAILPQ
ncbi:MAG TPA: hypothetical protein VLK82_00210, partial [Candidatus Tectomicrobia bacterium]|nr:hypothetical protein [Candidatus Tectomicrobia bacterium]